MVRWINDGTPNEDDDVESKYKYQVMAEGVLQSSKRAGGARHQQAGMGMALWLWLWSCGVCALALAALECGDAAKEWHYCATRHISLYRHIYVGLYSLLYVELIRQSELFTIRQSEVRRERTGKKKKKR